jgi:hypothetical protein
MTTASDIKVSKNNTISNQKLEKLTMESFWKCENLVPEIASRREMTLTLRRDVSEIENWRLLAEIPEEK